MKCVLTVAGLGTRLLPLTKGVPKEMLPMYARGAGGRAVLKPMLQIIYESLYGYGARDFCFVVGRTKRAVEEHFTPDPDLASHLSGPGRRGQAAAMAEFDGMLESSNISFRFQPRPDGFADAVLRARMFAGGDSFILHAGDDVVVSRGNAHLRRLRAAFEAHGAEAAFLVERVRDPSQYGIVSGRPLGRGVVDVRSVREKPRSSRSNLAVVAIYMLRPSVFGHIERAGAAGPEGRLAEAFNRIVRSGGRVVGVPLAGGERRVDIGTPETYSRVLVSLR